MSARSGRSDAVDAAMALLLRLVLDDTWSAASAAAKLREQVPSRAVLSRARARVSAAMAERVSAVAERAAETLDLALSVAGKASRDPAATSAALP